MKISPDKISLVIQGPYHPNSIKMIDNYHNLFGQIIFSTYETDIINLKKKYKKFNNVKIHFNTIELSKEIYNISNLYYQVMTTLNGVRISSKDFILKIRSDELYSNLEKIKFQDYCMTSNGFIRDWTYSRFHFSDHLFFLKKRTLKKALKSLAKYLTKRNDELKIKDFKTPPETCLFLFIFFSLRKTYDIDWRSNKKYDFKNAKDHFKIINVESLSPYLIRSSVSGEIENLKKFICYDTTQNLIYYNKLDQMSEKNLFQNFLNRVIFKLRKILFN